MGEILETKGRVLAILSNSCKTLTDMSGELQLARSTVYQHLKELEAMGMIEAVPNEHIKKWKYYRLTSAASAGGDPRMMVQVAMVRRRMQREQWY
ncbi:MAG TPA: winged helix-turn-helix domain-containing protein [Candidatus Acidoferrum sp.]|nr:winged helix-turn-helix domain-containing protein [Candidatus Acidoferrum sp.]